MTEEEKKAIDDLKLTIEQEKEELPYSKESLKNNETLVNLIEKQAKEIEELNKQYDQLTQYFIKNHVAKDKIREKLERLEKQKENYKEQPLIYMLLKNQYKELLEEG